MVKTSVVQAALAQAEIEGEVWLTHGQSSGIWASWNLPNAYVPHERWSIYIGCVPSDKAFAARRFVEEVALPEIVTWMRELEALPANSPSKQRRQTVDMRLPEHLLY